MGSGQRVRDHARQCQCGATSSSCYCTAEYKAAAAAAALPEAAELAAEQNALLQQQLQTVPG